MSQENVEVSEFEAGDPGPRRHDARDRLHPRTWQGKRGHDRFASRHRAEFKNGKGIRIRTYLDPKEALEAVGLSE